MKRQAKPRADRSLRPGFTLSEVLVTITLLAVLASVVVPTIISQVRKGDPVRLGSDLKAIHSASEQFMTDVQKMPSTIGQLTTPITAAQVPLAGTAIATFSTNEIGRWRGPYLSKDAVGTLSTGFGLTMNTAFDTTSLGLSGTVSAPGQRYMILAIPMMNGGNVVNDSLSILQLDRAFDDGVLVTGNIRYRIVPGGVDTLKYLVMPIF
jgi:prepilin-type N-terminal cleavage/methylation domain-containing protein